MHCNLRRGSGLVDGDDLGDAVHSLDQLDRFAAAGAGEILAELERDHAIGDDRTDLKPSVPILVTSSRRTLVESIVSFSCGVLHRGPRSGDWIL